MKLNPVITIVVIYGVSTQYTHTFSNPHTISSLASLSSNPSLRPRCLVDEPLPERKLFNHNGHANTIRLLGSHRVASRLLGSIFSIFAQEMLGYDVIVYQQEETLDSLDPQAQFARLSSCQLQYCQDLDITITDNSQLRVPDAMLALDLWLPAAQEVTAWGLLDAGQLGPATRFGWFIPSQAHTTAHSHGPNTLARTHWKLFASKDLVKPYILSEKLQRYIENHLQREDSSYFCPWSVCSEGQSVPDYCKEGDCATLVTDYPSNSSLYNSLQLIKYIKDNNLLVRVAYVGYHLTRVVDFLESETVNTSHSYVLLHYHPSVLTVKYNLTSILFPLCPEPLVNGREDRHECVYSPNRLAKVAWKPIQNKADVLWKFLEKFNFRYIDYVTLLNHYNDMTENNPMISIEDVACSWLQHIDPALNSSWYKQFPVDSQNLLFIGGIFPIKKNSKFTAPELVPVAIMAMNDINSHPSILPGYSLRLEIQDGECEADIVMKRFIDFIKNKNPTRFRSTIGILGPACSDTVEPIAGVSKHFKTVVISYSAEGSISERKNKDDFPYFFRTIAENKQYKHAYLGAFTRFGWTKVATLTQEGQKYSHYISQLQDEMQDNGIVFINNRKFPRDATDMNQYLTDLRDRGAKVIIGDFYEQAARHIMCQAYSLGMIQANGYVWFLPGWFKDGWYDLDHLQTLRSESLSAGKEWEGSLPENCTTAKMLEALDGAFSLVHNNYGPDTSITVGNITVAQWRRKLKKVLARFAADYKKQNPNFEYEDGNKPNKYSGYVYDAMWLYALVMHNLILQDKSLVQELHNDKSIAEFVRILKTMDFEGVSGRVNFKSGHSRLSEIRILQWNMQQLVEGDTNSKVVHVNEIGLYKPNYENNTSSLTWFDKRIQWKTEDGLKPTDQDRRCGILSPFAILMDLECQLTITVTFLLGFGSFIVILLSLFAGLKIRYERRMAATEERMRALGLLHSPLSVLALDDWEMPRDRVVINRKLGEGAFGMVYGGESFFDEKGWVAVAVKTLKTGSTLEEKVDFLSEADMMKRFEHRNIVRLLGVCTRNEPVYTVMEYMLYGDLKTYLLARRHLVNERNREELDEVSNKRLTCMALDIAAGLAYLAEQKYVHRDVACRNCLLNSGRTVKLADFGMTRAMFESDYYRFSRKGMLPVRWMAPESLSDGLFTPSSDIWSYGVLLYEIITFGSFPFQGLSNNQVLEQVKSGVTLSIPSGIKEQLGTLLRSCWSRSPTKRPTAAEVAELLYNNPRLISPCIDVPLASVQVERSDSLELLLIGRGNEDRDEEDKEEDTGLLNELRPGTYSPMMGTYSPMNGDLPRKRISKDQSVVNVSVGSYVQPGYIFMDNQ